MAALSTTIVPSTTFGTPSGNYDGSTITFNSDNSKGDGYLGYTDGLHTVAYYLNGFVGVITIQASLVTTPTTDADWFTVTNGVIGDGSTAMSTPGFVNFTGNFVWVRINVTQFSAGTITKILYNF